MGDVASTQGFEEQFGNKSDKIRQALLGTNEGGRSHV
jgi:hypothetical protein